MPYQFHKLSQKNIRPLLVHISFFLHLKNELTDMDEHFIVLKYHLKDINLGMVAHACNPHLEVIAAGTGVSSKSGLPSETRHPNQNYVVASTCITSSWKSSAFETCDFGSLN